MALVEQLIEGPRYVAAQGTRDHVNENNGVALLDSIGLPFGTRHLALRELEDVRARILCENHRPADSLKDGCSTEEDTEVRHVERSAGSLIIV